MAKKPTAHAVIGCLTLFLILVFVLSLFVGQEGNSLLFSSKNELREVGWFLLLELRLPRALLAMVAGAGLSLCGTVLQGYLRNPLAEPTILGVSGLGALGAVLAIFLGWFQVFPYAVPLCAMALAALCPFIFYIFLRGKWKVSTVILVGIGISNFVSAFTALFLNLMDKNYARLEIIFWLFGSFADRTLEQVLTIIPPIFCGIGLLLYKKSALDKMSFGEEMAQVLGVQMPAFSMRLILGIVLVIGPIVSLTGIIGFIGLIVPHILRFWLGEKPSHLLIPACLGGALFALGADIITRLLPTHGELKVGVVTALFGVPVFIQLVRRMSRASVQ